MEEGLDVDIIKYLAAENKIFSKEKIEHNYPSLLEMRNSAGILCEAVLVYRDEQAEGSAGGKQRYRQLVPCLCRRKAFRQLARRSKGLGYFQIEILGHAYSYLEMRVRSSGMRRLKSRIGGKGHGTDRREHRASQTVCGRRSS